jgi:hypothetical protein
MFENIKLDRIGVASIVDNIVATRVRWLGHVERTSMDLCLVLRERNRKEKN